MQTYRERTEWLVTHSKLEDFIFCAEAYRLQWVEWIDPPGEWESDALTVGSAYDALLQWYDYFQDRYVVVDRRSSKPTEKVELTKWMWETIQWMYNETKRQEFYNPIWEKQYNVQFQFSENIRLSGSIDELQKENNLIIDDKTSAGLNKFEEFRMKYKRQLAFYSFLMYETTKVCFDWMIRMVTKDKQPQAHFYFSNFADLQNEWDRFDKALKKLDECIRTWIYTPQPYRENCLNCKMFSKCKHSTQKTLNIL